MQSLELLEELPSFLSVGTTTAKQKQLSSVCLGIETSQHSETHVANTLHTLQDFCPGGIPVKLVWSPKHVWRGTTSKRLGYSRHSSTKFSVMAWVQAVRRTFKTSRNATAG